MKFSQILGYRVFAGSKAELFDYLDTFDKVNVVSGNPEVLYNGMNDRELFAIFTGRSSVIIPDGVGTVLASKLAGSPVEEKIAGIEVMEGIIGRCAEEGEGIYLLGAKEEVVAACAENLKLK